MALHGGECFDLLKTCEAEEVEAGEAHGLVEEASTQGADVVLGHASSLHLDWSSQVTLITHQSGQSLVTRLTAMSFSLCLAGLV